MPDRQGGMVPRGELIINDLLLTIPSSSPITSHTLPVPSRLVRPGGLGARYLYGRE